jgi:hypothetical protein
MTPIIFWAHTILPPLTAFGPLKLGHLALSNIAERNELFGSTSRTA